MDVLKSELLRIQELRLSKNELAYGSTILISIAPFLVLLLFKVDNSAKHRNKLRLALSFASGGLLGDAFLHLIPHSMGHHHEHHEDQNHQNHHHHHNESEPHHEHEHEHHHDHHAQTIVGLYIIMGIILFFIIEKFIHIVKGESHQHHHHHHHHHHQPKQQQLKKKDKQSDSDELETSDDDKPPQQSSLKHRKNKSPRKIKSKQRDSGIIPTRLVSGILNLIADFLHNFTDGLAIGATFAAGQGMGTITAVTILLHEIPHEIGDYAILIQAGYRRHNAMLLQLVTAIGALIGTAVGLHYGTLEHATQLILPITAGGFIYIATVSVIPELLEKANNHWQSLFEILSIFTGVAMMYWIALNE